MKTFVIGDIHGRYDALIEVLTKSKFDYKKDKLIILGDVVDGGNNTKKVIDEILRIKNYIFIVGNHDFWFLKFLNEGYSETLWLEQGGSETLRSYGAKVLEADYVSDMSKIDTTELYVPITHQHFLNNYHKYHIQDDMLFVHGGYDDLEGIENTGMHTLIWDRTLHQKCRNGKILKPYKKVFIGHTATQIYRNNRKIENCMIPLKFQNLIMMDTGAGWNGKLSIMNVDTEKYWQSKIQSPAVRGPVP